VTPEFPIVEALGDDAVLVTFGAAISHRTNDRVRAAVARIRALGMDAITDIVPAYTTLAVYLGNDHGSLDTIIDAVSHAIISAEAVADVQGSLIEIPVRYDGPDLSEVAERTGLRPAEIAELHMSQTYRAYMSGFVPGFAYLGELHESLVLPRRSAPRVRVPAGSVAIAGEQTAVYPFETPGGWHLIGSTSAVMFDPLRKRPALINAGDTVRFVDAGR
jgi:KipI family sensor histidine kinase inhibitor